MTKKLFCKWRYDDDGFWATECGDSFSFLISTVEYETEDSLKDHNVNYCHKCGLKIRQLKPKE